MPNNSAGPGLVILGRPQDDHRPAWRTVNITPTERLGRIAVGLAAVIAGIVLLTGVGSAVAVALDASAGRPVTAWGFRYRPSRWRHALGSAGPGRRW
jgi:hypothetical protein